jgi:hypothetical protein
MFSFLFTVSADPNRLQASDKWENGYGLVKKRKALQRKIKVISMSAFEINDLEF